MCEQSVNREKETTLKGLSIVTWRLQWRCRKSQERLSESAAPFSRDLEQLSLPWSLPCWAGMFRRALASNRGWRGPAIGIRLYFTPKLWWLQQVSAFLLHLLGRSDSTCLCLCCAICTRVQHVTCTLEVKSYVHCWEYQPARGTLNEPPRPPTPPHRKWPN